MKFRKYTLCAVVFLNLCVQVTGLHAAEVTSAEDSVVLSNVDEAEPPAAAAKPQQAASPAAQGAAASGTAAAGTAPVAMAPEVTPEQYKEHKVQQAAIPNGVNPASARRYLRVDKATMMEASGL